ncbi:MAG: hypothetical protein U0T74_04080 [Chitinophagales bacterium]
MQQKNSSLKLLQINQGIAVQLSLLLQNSKKTEVSIVVDDGVVKQKAPNQSGLSV